MCLATAILLSDGETNGVQLERDSALELDLETLEAETGKQLTTWNTPMKTMHAQQEANKRAARTLYDVWDGGDEEAIDDVMAEDVVLHKPDALGGSVRGRDAYKDNLRMIRAGFPDLFFQVHDVVAEDNKVIAYCTFGGTHDGELLGIEPTGASVEVWDFVMYRFDDGNVVEVRSLPNFLGLLLEIGAIEPPGAMST